MGRRILDVFLSSTALDLEPHRTAVHAELTSTSLFHCVRQEDFGAQDAGAVEFCQKKVEESDIFIGLVGQRRGWEPDGDADKRSITEMEHDWAKSARRRRFLYVAPDNFPVPGHLRDSNEQHDRQQQFRKRVMEGGERIVSQRGFEVPERFAAGIVKHLLTQMVTGDLITLLRPELSPQNLSADEQRPAIAAAVERLAEDSDVDLLALAKNPDVDLADIEAKLQARAQAQEVEGRSYLRSSAEYQRHIGAFAFLQDTDKALTAYQKAVELDPAEPDGWRYLGELQFRLGELEPARLSFTHLLELGNASGDPRTQSMGYLRLGWVAFQTGDLTRAEHLVADAVRLAEKAGWREGLARAYGNLGIIHMTRGALDQAEAMQRKALDLYRELDNKEGMAAAHSGLGNIHQSRGELTAAEAMHGRALALNTELGRKQGMAIAYGNIGNVHEARGEFDKAEEMQRQSLAMNEELGSKEGMALAYGNLGNIELARGHPDEAEQMQRAALALYEAFGSKEGMARSYANLGSIYESRGNKASMCECWRKARDLYREMELPKDVAEVEEWLELNECGGR
jgi:tetratricopeptide (TPR) repeat protein